MLQGTFVYLPYRFRVFSLPWWEFAVLYSAAAFVEGAQ